MISKSPDVIIYERSVYTILDLLGEVGGLLDGLNYIAMMILFLL